MKKAKHLSSKETVVLKDTGFELLESSSILSLIIFVILLASIREYTDEMINNETKLKFILSIYLYIIFH